jgi:hypothetical protein
VVLDSGGRGSAGQKKWIQGETFSLWYSNNMGRRLSKSSGSKFFEGIFKLAFVGALVFGLSYGVSIGIGAVSEMSFGRAYVKTLPYSEVLGKYVTRVGGVSGAVEDAAKAVSNTASSGISKITGKGASGTGGTDGVDGSAGSAGVSGSAGAGGSDAQNKSGSDQKSGQVGGGGFSINIDALTGKKDSDNTDGKVIKTVLGILSDSHNSNDNLEKAVNKAKEKGAKNLAFLGDYSDVGTVEEIQNGKKIMDASGLWYLSIPGDHDHDLGDGALTHYNQLFSARYGVKVVDGVRFIWLDNSANYTLIDNSQMVWFTNTLDASDDGVPTFVFLSNPLYNKDGFRLMGELNEDVKAQANLLLKLIRNSSVKAVFAGDNHLSSRSADPEKSQLEHIVVGALAKERNLQTPRFSMLHVFEDGTYKFEEVVL